MQELPLISVIVPVYRVERYLNKCVQSIVGQTYGNLEVILVEDGSPDNSGRICDEWAERDSRVKVIHKENGGGGQARNVALDAAKGEIIAFVDSDDYIAPEMFAHLYGFLEQGVDIAECGYLDTTDDHAVFAEEAAEWKEYSAPEAMRGNIYDTVFRQLIWNKLYRREVIGEIRFPEGTKIDDEFFTYRVLGNAKRLVRSERVCYAYRQQESSVMHEKYSLRRLEGLQAKAQRLEYLKIHMPELVHDGVLNVFFSCMHAMQMCQKHLTKAEQKTAWEEIQRVLAAVLPMRVGKEYTVKENIWIILSKISFRGTCRIRNFLFERD